MNNRQRIFIYALYCLLFLFLPTLLSAETTKEDSLTNLLLNTRDQQKRAEICSNLSDYCYYSDSENYSKITSQFLDESIKAKNEYYITKALRGLVMLVDRKNRVLTNDSIKQYIKIAETNLSGEWKKSFLTEIRLRHIRSKIEWTTDSEKTIADIMEQYTSPIDNKNDIYSQIEREYALGKMSCFVMHNWVENIINSLRYFDNLQILLKKIPLPHRAELFFCINEDSYVAYFNANNKAKAVKMLEFMFTTLEQYRNLDFVSKDIYRNYDNIYTLYYGGMARCPKIVGESKAIDCLYKADSVCRKPKGNILSLYYIYKAFYESMGDYCNAITYADSVLYAVRDSSFVETSIIILSMYKEQAKWYSTLNEYENAYKLLSRHVEMKDSMANIDARNVRQEMSVRYDVDKLELDKIRLESKNRQIGLIFIAIILTLSIAWGVTQQINVKKLKRIQKRLIESNKEVILHSEKAKESEKMKTAFINSMCHEIRTPLNSINGFSSLLLDDAIDDESKQAFPQLIRENTDRLTRLINDLLEIASLDSSVEELTSEQIDMGKILKQELDKLISDKKKEGIEYKLDVENVCMATTNPVYITRIISNILDNANNFTEKGLITLSCKKDDKQENLIISVTDTGIGIPEDKREWVFERFTKIDEFKPGVGLGLYACKLIIKRLNGSIFIDSEYTSGARFIITLPI